MEIKLRNTANKTIENNRGITLIALVITIIVLLILAGVTIATLTGDNRTITKSNKCEGRNNKSRRLRKSKISSNCKLWEKRKYRYKVTCKKFKQNR